MSIALLFPGQGSQAIGMGAALSEAFPEAKQTFEEVDDALNQNLRKIILEGPEELLTMTENAQPALMAVSIAIMRVLEKDGGFEISRQASFVAGHSLGEYSALAAAGSFSLFDTALLLRQRGKAMQEAVPLGDGGMAALLGANIESATELAEAASEGEVCSPANDNAPDQVVISGTTGAIDRAVQLAPDFGIKRAIPLQVSAPFHCSLMAPAAAVMADALQKVTISPPLLPLVSNVSARAIQEPDTIRRNLEKQVTAMVRWRESILEMKKEGVDKVVEIGSGRVLSGLMKRIDKEISAISVSDPESIESFLNSI
ncbi:MAG: [acyl-carrier-protein] S-malonyltransferase [Rhodospirillales bacterium]|nr:[acyl-carrier-protein] S-malonyltransferase [Rhodospirillales bacterium]